MVIRQATPGDIDLLVSLRLDFLREEFGEPAIDGMMPGLRERLEAYFCNHLGKEFFAWVAEIDERAVSSVFCVLDEHPATPASPTGRIATLLNVYTDPVFRRRGIATLLLEAVMREAAERGADRVDLSATSAGLPLYEKMGFVKSRYTAMRLDLPARETHHE